MTRFDWQHGLGLTSLDEAIDLVRKEIYAGCSHSPTKFMSRRRATKRLEEDACVAIAYSYSKLNPDRTYIVKKDWPRAFAMIVKAAEGDGYEAIIEPWLGHDDITNVDGIEPVRVPIEWGQQPVGVLSRIRNMFPWGRTNKAEDERPVLDLTQPVAPAAPPKPGYRETIGAPAQPTPPPPTARSSSPKPYTPPAQPATPPKTQAPSKPSVKARLDARSKPAPPRTQR